MSCRPVSKALAALLAVAASAVPCVQGETACESLSAEVRVVFEREKAAVVKIQAIDEHGPLSGSGFFIEPDGTIYTSYTVGGESHDIVVLTGDKRYPATRLLADPRSGLAILKVEADTPFLPLGKSSALYLASMVMTIGYPMEFPVTPSLGMVAGFDVKHGGRYFSTAHIRANVPVQRGEGGAPLLNMNGEVVGILISSLDSGAGCFALPIEAAEKVRKDFVRFGEVRPGWLGIEIEESKTAGQESAAQVKGFVNDAPAGKTGLLEKGDILLQIGDTKVKKLEDVLNASFFLTGGDEVALTVLRNGTPLSVNVQAGDHPDKPHKTALAPGENMLLSTP